MMGIIIFLLAQVDITTTLAPEYKNKTLTIGDPFKIQVTVTYPHNATVSEIFIDLLGSFMILEQTNKIVTKEGITRNTHDITMTVFDTGEMDLPQFQVHHTRGDTIDTITSAVVPITINSVLPDDMTDINDIKKAVEFPNFFPLIIAGIVLVAVVLTLIGYRVIKQIMRARKRAPPPLPAWIEALAAIDTIPVKEWLAQRWIKRYYYALSEILKRYLERRFAFNAVEQTTSEIISTMKTKQVPERNEFHNFFMRADMVKYAKTIPPDHELFAAIEKARDLVNRTTPQPEEPQ